MGIIMGYFRVLSVVHLFIIKNDQNDKKVMLET